MVFRGQSWVVYAIWVFLTGSFLYEMVSQNWRMGFIAGATLMATILPGFIADRYQIRIPVYFFAGMVLFIFATLFLGEAFDFYERFWWWDTVLHAASAIGFGLIGIILALILFEGDRYAAPAWAIAAIAFAFAMTIGTLWEVFEFAMDQLFGLNMQKSGLDDTMWDLIVDAGGGLVGALAGFGFLRGRDRYGLPGQIGEFVRRNKGFFRRSQ